ncbi:dihydrofolate reductase family protein [Pseudonocardia spinosispora]|uniref:dihydrofolate reductase family protein n=1 Tax=Pseudonocardia spinosispora TaxID=103441 RepID=UPI0003F9F0D2|nr:dihydrofolate reductase family protein [Pseudonocardia spinosispora]
MTTQYYTATSIDGFIADADNSLDWLLQFGDGSGDTYSAFIAEVGAIVMGSTTYEWVLEHHVNADADHPRPWMYEQPTWVFSSRELPGVEGADIRFVRGDVVAVHATMTEAAHGKNIWIVGGGELAGQFHDHGLLDELILGVAPIALGAGAPLLPRVISHPPMRLTDVRQDGPFALLTYAVRG